MNSILAVEKGLPPGLWLPTADESTEKYLSENFYRPNIEYEELVEYGKFVISLIFLEQANTERISLMPRLADLDAMYEAGYGIPTHSFSNHYGGTKRLQHALGFHYNGYRPSETELLERFKWMADYAYPQELLTGENKVTKIHDIIKWGTARNLVPTEHVVRSILGGSNAKVMHIFNRHQHDADRDVDYMSVYRFGAQVLKEHGRKLSSEELDKLYPDVFPYPPSIVIKAKFKDRVRDFWQEFGFVPSIRKTSPDQPLIIGVRWAIANGFKNIEDVTMKAEDIREMSRNGRFISLGPIYNKFGNSENYFKEVQLLYKSYLQQQEEFADQGVAPHIFRVACRNYLPTPEFEINLNKHISTLRKLSDNSEKSKYIVGIMTDGFNLLDEEIYRLQFKDVKKYLRDLGITDKEEICFVFDIIPHINTKEALSGIKKA